jgi:hypothetical protein
MVACKLTWQNMWAYKTVTSNICRNINDELLMVSGLEFIMRIVLCPLVVMVKMYDAISSKNLPQLKRAPT